jgi:biotin operon repressor
VSEFVSGFALGERLGLAEAEVRKLLEYHAEKGNVHVDDHRGGIVRLTAAGVDAVEGGKA